jgi:hypothetical protein
VTRDWKHTVTIDPTLEELGVEIQAMRYTGDDEPFDGDRFQYHFAAAVRKTGKRWPKGRYVIQTYDADSVLLDRCVLDVRRTLDEAVRQLEDTLYGPAPARSELIFETERAIAVDEDEWEPIEVETRDAEAELLGVKFAKFRAELREDFEYNNLTLIQVRGQVKPKGSLPFPIGLCAEITVFDAEDNVLSNGQFSLASGPSTRRTLDAVVKIYRHQEPTVVRIGVYTD